jgi:enoyl-CoA hydratase/3-hydroxyacyl-CoA dehydrogenase
MPYRSPALSVDKIGVIGSGQIGPDIALYFAKTLSAHGVSVVVVDVAPDALERGRAKLEQKISKGRESGAFRPEAAEAIARAVSFTGDYEQLRAANLVVEAATENVEIKRRIFARLEEVCGASTVLASNSSHLPPEQIFQELAYPGRALVIHYFFPAERNPIVEIVSGRQSDPALTESLLAFYEGIGKVPLRVRSRYGFAVNPVFEGIFLAAALAVEAGLGTTREVDAAARRALGLRVGPFTAMNLTGGNPITDHGLDELGRVAGSWFRSPRLLKEAIAAGRPWEVPGRGEELPLPSEREQPIAALMQGAYFGLVGQILDSGIISLADLELGVELGLAIRAPFDLMNEIGVGPSLALVEAYARAHSGFPVPSSLRQQARAGQPFEIPYVLRRDVDGVAVLTIRRPQVLNALNEAVYAQLTRHFAVLQDDPKIAAVVLTGFGTKAFVSGADVNFLARITGPVDGAATSQRSQAPGNSIENLGKPVICALNGPAIGGGNELAMCCTARIARRGLTVAVSQPEANLGIVPGSGATQRLPRLVGIETAATMLRTGRPLSGVEAVRAGLIREEVDGDLLEAAIGLARRAARGELELTPLDPRPIHTPDQLPPADLGHLSRATDRLIGRAIIEGCRLPLREGLRLESELFGACCASDDMRIGIGTFLAGGPRAKASFVHR